MEGVSVSTGSSTEIPDERDGRNRTRRTGFFGYKRSLRIAHSLGLGPKGVPHYSTITRSNKQVKNNKNKKERRKQLLRIISGIDIGIPVVIVALSAIFWLYLYGALRYNLYHLHEKVSLPLKSYRLDSYGGREAAVRSYSSVYQHGFIQYLQQDQESVSHCRHRYYFGYLFCPSNVPTSNGLRSTRGAPEGEEENQLILSESNGETWPCCSLRLQGRFRLLQQDQRIPPEDWCYIRDRILGARIGYNSYTGRRAPQEEEENQLGKGSIKIYQPDIVQGLTKDLIGYSMSTYILQREEETETTYKGKKQLQRHHIIWQDYNLRVKTNQTTRTQSKELARYSFNQDNYVPGIHSFTSESFYFKHVSLSNRILPRTMPTLQQDQDTSSESSSSSSSSGLGLSSLGSMSTTHNVKEATPRRNSGISEHKQEYDGEDSSISSREMMTPERKNDTFNINDILQDSDDSDVPHSPGEDSVIPQDKEKRLQEEDQSPIKDNKKQNNQGTPMRQDDEEENEEGSKEQVQDGQSDSKAGDRDHSGGPGTPMRQDGEEYKEENEEENKGQEQDGQEGSNKASDHNHNGEPSTAGMATPHKGSEANTQAETQDGAPGVTPSPKLPSQESADIDATYITPKNETKLLKKLIESLPESIRMLASFPYSRLLHDPNHPGGGLQSIVFKHTAAMKKIARHSVADAPDDTVDLTLPELIQMGVKVMNNNEAVDDISSETLAKIKLMFIRLSKTEPFSLFKRRSSDDNMIRATDCSRVWKASVDLFGHRYNKNSKKAKQGSMLSFVSCSNRPKDSQATWVKVNPPKQAPKPTKTLKSTAKSGKNGQRGGQKSPSQNKKAAEDLLAGGGPTDAKNMKKNKKVGFQQDGDKRNEGMSTPTAKVNSPPPIRRNVAQGQVLPNSTNGGGADDGVQAQQQQSTGGTRPNNQQRQQGNGNTSSGGQAGANLAQRQQQVPQPLNEPPPPPPRHAFRANMIVPIPKSGHNPNVFFVEFFRAWMTCTQGVDPALQVQPWSASSTAPPITRPEDIPERLDRLREYLPRLSPINGKSAFTNVLIRMNDNPLLVTSERPESIVEGFYNNYNLQGDDEKTKRCSFKRNPVQDAEQSKQFGVFILTSPFDNAGRIEDQYRPVFNTIAVKEGRDLPKFGIMHQYNNEVPDVGGEFRYPLTSNRPLTLFAYLPDGPWLAECLYTICNKMNDPTMKPGMIQTRFIADNEVQRRIIYRKHVDYVLNLAPPIDCYTIRDLDENFRTRDGIFTLRKFIMGLTNPLIPPRDPISGDAVVVTPEGHIKRTSDGKRNAAPEPLFHGVEFDQRQGQASTCLFVTYKDRLALARSIVAILPALVNLIFHELPKGWFCPNAKAILNQVTFEYGEETGEWTGEWTTTTDRSHDTMISEELPGMDNFHIENMAEMVRQNNAENRPQVDVGDAASVGTSVNTEVFQAALGQGPADNNQEPTDEMNSNDEGNDGNDPQQAGARTSPPVSTETAGHSDEGGRPGL